MEFFLVVVARRSMLWRNSYFAHFSIVLRRELHTLVKSRHCLKGPNHEHLQGGISFGIGAFNLVGANSFSLMSLPPLVCTPRRALHSLSAFVYLQTLSLFPPRILKVLEFAGFSGDKVFFSATQGRQHGLIAGKLTEAVWMFMDAHELSWPTCPGFRSMVWPSYMKVRRRKTCAPCCVLCCSSATTPFLPSY